MPGNEDQPRAADGKWGSGGGDSSSSSTGGGIHGKSVIGLDAVTKPADLATVKGATEWKAMPQYLEGHPVGVRFGNAGDKDTLASYNHVETRITVGAVKPSYGKSAGSAYTIAEMAPTRAEAKERGLFHEAMHHVEYSSGLANPNNYSNAKLTGPLQAAYSAAKKSGGGSSEYGRGNVREYFAETATAYRYESAHLQRVDPAGHAAVHSILKHTGIV